jgi:hypothetical protein
MLKIVVHLAALNGGVGVPGEPTRFEGVTIAPPTAVLDLSNERFVVATAMAAPGRS